MIERLETVDTDLIATRLRNLNQVYFITEDEKVRRQILLTIDELKLELIKRGKYDPTS
jgi:hypothetical protein